MSTRKHLDTREIRTYAAPQPFEVRKNSDGSRTIAGAAVVYNTLSGDLGFRERIMPGAFTQSLRDNPDILIAYNHEIGQILGRVSAGTATVTDTAKSLNFTCKLPNTTWGNDLAVSMERGDVKHMSFGFSVNPSGDSWTSLPNGESLRTVTSAQIYELSAVPLPAYSSSSVGILRAALRNCPLDIRAKLAASLRDDQLTDDDEADIDGICGNDNCEICSVRCTRCTRCGIRCMKHRDDGYGDNIGDRSAKLLALIARRSSY